MFVDCYNINGNLCYLALNRLLQAELFVLHARYAIKTEGLTVGLKALFPVWHGLFDAWQAFNHHTTPTTIFMLQG